MPGMLGWFLLTEKSSLDDIEWMLSKAAGYNAGFGFVCNYKSLEGNGQTGAILATIRRWETARMKQLFSPEVQEMLQSTDREYHLVEGPGGELRLWSAVIGRMEYLASERQPGEHEWTTMDFDNGFASQPLRFTLTVPEQAGISGLEIAIDNVPVLLIDRAFQPGQIIRYGGGDEISIYSSRWVLQETVPVDPERLTLAEGEHLLAFRAIVAVPMEQPVKVEFKTIGNLQNIPSS